MAIIKVKISEARVEYLEHLEARGVKASTRRVYESRVAARAAVNYLNGGNGQ